MWKLDEKSFNTDYKSLLKRSIHHFVFEQNKETVTA